MFICTLGKTDSERKRKVSCDVNTVTSCWWFALYHPVCTCIFEELYPIREDVLDPSSHTAP